ncbi:MAG: hypothetical protein ACLPY3_03325 [Solirubrobacteraceae bacterium]
MTPQQKPVLALRVAHDDEGDLVRRIADLDNARTLNGEVLLALVDGEPVAARSLRDGRVVANPFVRTADAVALLDFRASQLTATRRRRRRRLGLGLGRVAHRPAA